MSKEFPDVYHNGCRVITRQQQDGSFETAFYINGKYAAIHITCTPGASRSVEQIEQDAIENHAYYTLRAREMVQD